MKEETNVVNLRGRIENSLEFSHEIYGEKFYTTNIQVDRLSDSKDNLPITISERLLEDIDLNEDNIFNVCGQLRSYNKVVDDRNRLVLTVFIRELSLTDEKDKNDPNNIFLDGFICKNPVYRQTPLGREITDLLVAINRPYNKSDYIPCIVWGRNAKFTKNLEIGDKVQLWGRIQSREYDKRLDSGEVIKKVAYEVSISKIKKD
ncbi:MAG: single-stranded DNA-binding protein [Peptostreptococcaceae bacterium]